MRREIEDLPGSAEDLISQVGPGGHYLEQPDTVANCRSAFFRSALSDHTNWDSWMKNIVIKCPKKVWPVSRKNTVNKATNMICGG